MPVTVSIQAKVNNNRTLYWLSASVLTNKLMFDLKADTTFKPHDTMELTADFHCIVSCLFLDHPLDVVIVRLQVGIAEARVYPLLVTGSQFGYDVDLRLADIAHIFGSSPVMSPT